MKVSKGMVQNLEDQIQNIVAKTKPAHTPTPWKSLGGIILTDDGKNVEIGTTRYLPSENSHANAAFIVKAVNAHEELLWAAKIAKDWTNDTRTRIRINEAIARAEKI